MPNKELIEKVARISRACDMKLLGYSQEPEEGTTEGLDLEKAEDIIKIIAEEIKRSLEKNTYKLSGNPKLRRIRFYESDWQSFWGEYLK